VRQHWWDNIINLFARVVEDHTRTVRFGDGLSCHSLINYHCESYSDESDIFVQYCICIRIIAVTLPARWFLFWLVRHMIILLRPKYRATFSPQHVQSVYINTYIVYIGTFYAVKQKDYSNKRPVLFIVFARTRLFEFCIWPHGVPFDTKLTFD